MVSSVSPKEVFSESVLQELFPIDLADRFFEALYGDVAEGAYDIELALREANENKLFFEFHLKPRLGKCLACNLTLGLPQVFSRHPIINIDGLVQKIDQLLDGQAGCTDWQIGMTRQVSDALHVIPLIISLNLAD